MASWRGVEKAALTERIVPVLSGNSGWMRKMLPDDGRIWKLEARAFRLVLVLASAQTQWGTSRFQ